MKPLYHTVTTTAAAVSGECCNFVSQNEIKIWYLRTQLVQT